jgi:hypothetical protein
MKRIFLLFSVCAVLFTAVAARISFAATYMNGTDITGTWAGDVTGPSGNSFTFTYTFKVDGTKLTGTVQGPRGDTRSLDNGKVDGDKFSFDVSVSGTTINNEGTVNADGTIKLSTRTSDGRFPPNQFTIKRVKADAPAPAASAATDITGTWSGDLSDPNGNSFTLTYTFKVDGAKLTGTVQGPQGDPISLDNGKIDGEKLSFDVNVNGTMFNNAGTVNADGTIKLSSKTTDGSFPDSVFTLKRVKAADAPKPAM